MIEFLIQTIVILFIIGTLLWAVKQIPGIPEVAKTFIYVIAAIFIVLWLADSRGLLHAGFPAWHSRIGCN